MAVDRGGLSYTIKVRDEFSKTTARFKSEMRASKAAFAEFKKGVESQKKSSASFKETNKEIDAQTAALKRAQAETIKSNRIGAENHRIQQRFSAEESKLRRQKEADERKASREREKSLKEEQKQLKAAIDARNRAANQAQKLEEARRRDEARNLLDQQRQLKAFAEAQNRREAEAVKISKSFAKERDLIAKERLKQEKEAAKVAAQVQKDRERKQRQDPAFIAQKRLNDGLKEELVQRNQISLLRTKAKSQFAQGDLFGGAKSLKQAKELEKQLKDIDKVGNNLFFTFRRLVGVLAVFTIARNVVQGFQDLVKAGIQFNDKIQGATTAIGGLVVAVADVRDQFGLSVEPAEELGLAMQAAQGQVKKLRQDALRTVATFEQLLDTFQVAVAPGFAAGLNLDEIRKLTVSISQAATAIGVEQNQLAEEVRSLLSGTIQARTTRIATALGITNADIRRLKQTGELFTFLEERFEGFGLAAERQARTTVAGISTLIEGATTELLGDAAKPLFDELLRLGNQFFDQVLTIRDAAGDLKPNPEVVAGFREIFEALANGVKSIKESAEDLGFDGLRNTFRAVGAALVTGIQFAIGFAKTLLGVLNGIVEAIRSISASFGITTVQLGSLAGVLGSVIAATVIWNNTLGLVGLNVKTILTSIPAIFRGLVSVALATANWRTSLVSSSGIWSVIGATIAAVIVGMDQLLGSIFDVNLELSETVSLIGKGIAAQLKESLKGLKGIAILLDPTITAEEGAEKLRALAAELRADEEKFNKEVADIIANAAAREARGPGFDVAAGLRKQLDDASKAGTDFKGIISAVDSEISSLAGSMLELQDNILSAGDEFRAAFNSEDLQGVGAKVQDIFSDQLVATAEKLRKLRSAELKVQEGIATIIDDQAISAKRFADIQRAATSDIRDRKKALESLNLTEQEALVVSLLRDQEGLREALTQFEEDSLRLAKAKAATLAVGAARDLAREATTLQAQLAAERNITDVVVKRLGARRAAVVEAENALALAKQESAATEESLQKQIEFLRTTIGAQTGDDGTTAAERAANQALLDQLVQRLGLEQALSAEKEKQLEIARQEAALIESGSLGQGLTRGLETIAQDLPTAFEAGIAIVRQSTQALADFISTSIVQAFDPTADGSLQERFARFLQGIANIILQQIIQLAISSALQQTLGASQKAAIEVTAATTVAGIQVTAATTVAAIQVGAAQAVAAIRASTGQFGAFHDGGMVKGFNKGGPVSLARKAASVAHSTAAGYASGGPPRPAGLHPSDTIPAWLQPGEFVVRKAAVDKFGAGFFKAVNNGNFPVTGAAPSGAHAVASSGMAKGGLVSDQLQRAAVAGPSGGDGRIQVIPVQVAGERQLDRLLAGGKGAARQLFQDNAGLIRQIAKGG